MTGYTHSKGFVVAPPHRIYFLFTTVTNQLISAVANGLQLTFINTPVWRKGKPQIISKFVFNKVDVGGGCYFWRILINITMKVFVLRFYQHDGALNILQFRYQLSGMCFVYVILCNNLECTTEMYRFVKDFGGVINL